MTEPCRDLVLFADGELDGDRADAFRAHLATCATCQAELLEAMQLHARLSALPPPVALRLVADTAPDGVEPGGPAASAAPSGASAAGAPEPRGPISETSSVSSARGELAKLRLPARKPRAAKPTWKPWSRAALAAIAAVVAVLLVIPHAPTPPAVSVTTNPFADLKTRPFDIRIAYADASAYRPLSARTRGLDDPPREQLPYGKLAGLEARHDSHGLAIAEIWNGGNLAQVVTRLRGLTATAAVQNDLAAIESLRTSEDNLEPILRELEAVQHVGDLTAARAATWNYAVQLEKLGLPRSAASAFDKIANDREPGWSDEARRRAQLATDHAAGFEHAWQRALRAGNALWKTGAPVPAETMQRASGVVRGYLYQAVRTAPTRDRVLALAALAAELDGPGEPPILGRYVQRVAKLDFARRAPLASAYARALEGAALTPDETRQLTTPAPTADVADIVLGGLIRLDAASTHLDAFRALAKATGDPWFAVVLARAEAEADVRRGDWLGAEARLRGAQAWCTPSVTAPCLDLAGRLGQVYRELHRVPLALGVVQAGLHAAERAGEWSHYRQLLFQLSEIERFAAATATARAYAAEVLHMSSAPVDCPQRRAALQVVAGAALLDGNGHAARDALEASLACQPPDLAAASDLADIGRLDARAGDLAQLQRWLRALRASHTLTPAQLVVADTIEGRLMIERERAQGRELLARAIAQADAMPEDLTTDAARATAYSTLVFDAAQSADHPRVLALLAQELGLPTPATCAVALCAEAERAVVVVRAADGQDHGSYDAHRPHTDGLAVTDALARNLAGCAHVQVMAGASLQGQPHVLPAAQAWSYASSAHRRRPGAVAGSPPARRLIVMNVVPPAELQLPALLAEPLDTSPMVRSLSGRDATPTRVLAAMNDATEIQLHAHALVALGVPGASHLVLSPEPSGRYALTADAIRGSKLRGHPVVVLAACHAAQGARAHRASWSLPDAFIGAGARAVFAAGSETPDREAGPFFERVLARVRTGADPATALRDERVQTLVTNPASWVGDVMLFE